MDIQKTANTQPENFPPVVAVLGHVDHGKTTLLDSIRKTSIADREFGGITQKIGVSSIEIVHEKVKRRITFIDTPGHQVFSQMRSRGAQVADIGLLVISSVDGVMPQTKESIQVLLDAKIPYIVVLTKADLEGKNPEKIKQQLVKEGVLLEGLGGNIPVIEISAKTNTNIKELLDLILLSFDLHKKSDVSAKGELVAIVIESRLDQRAGPQAALVIKNGTLTVRDDVIVDGTIFRVRNIVNDMGQNVKTATIGDGVEVFGMSQVIPVGSIITDKNKRQVEKLPEEALALEPESEIVYRPNMHEGKLPIILIADTQGSLEAIEYSLPKDVHIINKKTGEVSEADILFAKSAGALVLSFNSKIRPNVQKLAMTEKVLAKNYQIIYEMIDEVSDVLEGKRLAQMEEIYGTARVLAKFPFEKTFAYGVTVLEGRIARGDRIRIMRKDETIGETTITSLRVGKEQTSKVESGHEAGIVLGGGLDIEVGDVVVCHSKII